MMKARGPEELSSSGLLIDGRWNRSKTEMCAEMLLINFFIYEYLICYCSPKKLREGNVFSSVYLSMWPLPMINWTSLYRTPSVQDLGPPPVQGSTSCSLCTPASDIWWPRLYICSNLFTWGTHCTAHFWWHLSAGYVWWASGKYASYWKSFLLSNSFT